MFLAIVRPVDRVPLGDARPLVAGIGLNLQEGGVVAFEPRRCQHPTVIGFGVDAYAPPARDRSRARCVAVNHGLAVHRLVVVVVAEPEHVGVRLLAQQPLRSQTGVDKHIVPALDVQLGLTKEMEVRGRNGFAQLLSQPIDVSRAHWRRPGDSIRGQGLHAPVVKPGGPLRAPIDHVEQELLVVPAQEHDLAWLGVAQRNQAVNDPPRLRSPVDIVAQEYRGNLGP